MLYFVTFLLGALCMLLGLFAFAKYTMYKKEKDKEKK